jgi:hypothetical protein
MGAYNQSYIMNNSVIKLQNILSEVWDELNKNEPISKEEKRILTQLQIHNPLISYGLKSYGLNKQGHISYIGIGNDAAANLLPGLKYLSRIDASLSDLSDQGLISITRCKSVVEIILLRCNKISPNGIIYLQNMNQLRELHFNPKINADLCAKYISKIKSLKILGITDSAITDLGLSYIAKIPNLKELDLSGSKYISNRGIAKLKNMSHIRQLSIEICRLTNMSIKYISKIHTLNKL